MRLNTCGVLTVFLLALTTGPSGAADRAKEVSLPMLKVGDQAPDFEIPAQGDNGQPQRLSDYRGRAVVVTFFPKVFSLGCTRQLTEYAKEYDVFQNADTEIVAISGDSQSDSDRFRDRYNLPFPVVGDPDHAIINRFGVPSRAYLGSLYAQRSVFLVDADGVIRYIELNYSVLRSKDALYDAVKELDAQETTTSNCETSP